MEKHCPDHGDFRDIVYSDARLYLKMEEWTFGDNRGLDNPAVTNATRCPDDCGLCNLHTSHTGLANVDLTNRCNLTCPVCFANANAAGLPLRAGFRDRAQHAAGAARPAARWPAASCSFRAASPPSIRASSTSCAWPGRWASRTLQAATNGIKFTDLEFAQQCKEAGLHTLYLQFDGVCDDVYRRTRGESLWEKKLQCIENVRKAGLKIVFVPTIVKGLNDHQIGDIVRLALEYIDCTSGISFQPVAFTGRIARHELEAKRFTLSDFAHAVQQQTGIADPYEDWFPLSCVTPFSKLLSALRGEETTTLSCHPHCSLGTYLFVDQNRKAVPVTQFVEVGPMLQEMDVLARKAGKRRFQFFTKFEAWNSLRKFFHEEKAPEGLTFNKFLQTLQGMTDKKYGRGESEKQGLHLPHPDAGRHALHGFLQLRRGAREALRDPLRRAQRPDLPVLRLQLRPGLPRAHREGILDPVRGAGRVPPSECPCQEELRNLRTGTGGLGGLWGRPPGLSVPSRAASGSAGHPNPSCPFRGAAASAGSNPCHRYLCAGSRSLRAGP